MACYEFIVDIHSKDMSTSLNGSLRVQSNTLEGASCDIFEKSLEYAISRMKDNRVSLDLYNLAIELEKGGYITVSVILGKQSNIRPHILVYYTHNEYYDIKFSTYMGDQP